MKRSILALMCALASLPVIQVGAYEFQPLGFESIGMGGAGVAGARGAMAGYYNPALLAQSPYAVETNLGGGVGIRERNLAENIDQLADMNLSDTLDRIADSLSLDKESFQPNSAIDRRNVTKFKAILAKIGDDNGLSVTPTVAFGSQVKNIAVGVFLTSDLSTQAFISSTNTELVFWDEPDTSGKPDVYYKYDPGDPDNVNAPERFLYNAYDSQGNSLGDLSDEENPNYGSVDLPDLAVFDPTLTKERYETESLQYAVETKATYVRGRGIMLTEIPVSYARQVPNPFGKLALGASVAALIGATYDQKIDIDTESDELTDNLDDSKELSSSIGVDVGALYQPTAVPNLTVGLVGKHLNSPSFKASSGRSFTVKPMYRAGVNYKVLGDTIDLAADLDLIANTAASGKESQYLGGGVNFHPASWFSLRAGAMRNLADANDGLIYTAGVGFGLKWIQFDLAGQASTSTTTYDGNEIPSYARVNASFISRW